MSTQTRRSIEIEFAAETWELLPEKAIFSPRRRSLIVADVHIGKGAMFRALGVPVPVGSSSKDLSRLSSLIEITGARRLVILGDFFHARTGRDDALHAAIAAWRRSHAEVRMLLVRGNHDRSAGRVLDEWGIEEVEERYDDDGLLLCHTPHAAPTRPMLCGHVHPVFAMTDYDGSTVRTPCFVVEQRMLMLPSFGTLTGGHRIDADENRRIFLIAGSRVVAVPMTR